jgi:putative lipoic acid-binding regulatory protein
MAENTQAPVLTFPCEFIIKTFGLATTEFETAVIAIIRKHVTELREDAFRLRPSKDGKYMAMTITINVDSREQLDDLYRDLSSEPLVLMAL